MMRLMSDDEDGSDVMRLMSYDEDDVTGDSARVSGQVPAASAEQLRPDRRCRRSRVSGRRVFGGGRGRQDRGGRL